MGLFHIKSLLILIIDIINTYFKFMPRTHLAPLILLLCIKVRRSVVTQMWSNTLKT